MIDISFKLISAVHPYEQFNIVVRSGITLHRCLSESPGCMVHQFGKLTTLNITSNHSQPVIFISYIHILSENVIDAKWMQ